MDKWFKEDWRFKIEVVKVGKENQAMECRLGLETGDIFECLYGTPSGFCPTSFVKVFPAMEAVRCGGICGIWAEKINQRCSSRARMA